LPERTRGGKCGVAQAGTPAQRLSRCYVKLAAFHFKLLSNSFIFFPNNFEAFGALPVIMFPSTVTPGPV
jgi:hypothetical protein